MDQNQIDEQFFLQLKGLCAAFGWVLAINDQRDGVEGVILGNPDYVESILTESEDFEEYTMYAPGLEGGH